MDSYSHRTRIAASVIGALLGLAGILNHGIFEILQGDVPTKGFFIEAIGEAHRFWIHGTEGAVTFVPNFLATGILAILVGLALIAWSAMYVQKKHGATVLLILFVLLTLVGGGIGHLVMFLPTWAYATRIRKPLTWWRRRLTGSAGKTLSRLWSYGLAATVLLWLTVMELGVFGYFPLQTDPDTILNIVLVFLLASVLMANFTFVCAMARDVEERDAAA